jgi:hypothetical protein
VEEDALIDRILELMLTLIESGVELDQELIQSVSAILKDAIQSSEVQAQAPSPPITDPTTLLWILSGGNEDAFVNYLRTYPDPQLNTLLKSPQQLVRVIDELKRSNPIVDLTKQNADGIPHGPLQSSNIYGFRYDPKSGKLLVRFNSGSVYSYDGVPAGIFKVFADGAVPAKTSGKNNFGKWWVGKIPSAGASFYEMIRKGGFPYQRIK